jgi:hypothetical protein
MARMSKKTPIISKRSVELQGKAEGECGTLLWGRKKNIIPTNFSLI